MPNRLPNRFDVIYAHGINDKDKEDCIGYILDIRENEAKAKKVINNQGLPSYTPKDYYIKFLNKEIQTYNEEDVLRYISSNKWKSCEPESLPNLDTPKYNNGDLLFNKKNGKVSLFIEIVNSKTGHEDLQTKMHSQFWYKIQAPGQKWEPISETFIEHGIKNGFIEVHRKKTNEKQ